MQLPIYLDNNATTPCDPRVVEAMLPYFTRQFGNAASRHHVFGWAADAAVDLAREQVAALIGAEPGEIIFTSGATEAINLALQGAFEMYRTKGAHIITTTIEHKAVLDTCHRAEKLGAEVSYIPVNQTGRVNPADIEAAIKPTTILVAVMYANNEVGTIQPIADISAICRQHGVLFFTDATQAVGKIAVDVNKDGIDLLSLSAHKLYGPKGAGALYVRRKGPRVRLVPQVYGGGHEKGLRSGTLNVPGIVGLGAACAIGLKQMEADSNNTKLLRDKLEDALLQLPQAAINGDAANRLPGTTNIRFAGVESEGLLMKVSKEIALSSGSACTSGSIEPSYVLKALGLPDEAAYSSIRFGVGRFNTEEEINHVVKKVSEAVIELRSLNPFWEG